MQVFAQKHQIADIALYKFYILIFAYLIGNDQDFFYSQFRCKSSYGIGGLQAPLRSLQSTELGTLALELLVRLALPLARDVESLLEL